MSESVSAEERNERFRSMIGDLRERIHELQIFDGPGQVQEYCTDLKVEVTLTYQSAVAHLDSLHQEMLKEIAEYRAKLLVSSAQDSSECEEELNALSQEVETVNKAGELEPSKQINNIWYNSMLEKTRNINDIRMRKAFGEQFLEFKPNRLFSFAHDHIGSFKYFHFDHRLLRDRNRSIHNKIEESPSKISIQNHDTLTGLSFLCDNNLAATLKSTTKVFDRETGQELLTFAEKHMSCSIATIDDELIAIGTQEGRIQVWNVKKGEICYQFFCCHKGPVLSLKVLRSTHLASRSVDKTIKILDVSRKSSEYSQLLKITGCDAEISWFFLDELSNGYIVANTAVSCEDTEKLKIWSCTQDKMVKEIDTGLKNLTGMCVLKNDNVAVASFVGDIKIINIFDPSLTRTLTVGNQGNYIQMFRKLPNDHLLEADSTATPFIYIWDPDWGCIVQTLEMDSLSPAMWFDLSPCQRFMAIGTKDKVVRVWSIDDFPKEFRDLLK